MKCFYHNDKDAIGICKSCEKGLCKDCAVDLGKGLACKNQCEEEVENLISYTKRNIQDTSKTEKIIDAGKTGMFLTSLFNMILGIAFIIWGLVSNGISFISIIGGLFVVYGIITLIRNLRVPELSSKKLKT